MTRDYEDTKQLAKDCNLVAQVLRDAGIFSTCSWDKKGAEMKKTVSELAWQAAGVPISFEFGLDGLVYAVLPNEYEAEDYCTLIEEDYETYGLYCFRGLFNAVKLHETLGM